MNNYKVLFSLRVLKNIITNFVDSFLVQKEEISEI